MGPQSRFSLQRVVGRTDCQIFEMVPGGGGTPPGRRRLAHLAGLCGRWDPCPVDLGVVRVGPLLEGDEVGEGPTPGCALHSLDAIRLDTLALVGRGIALGRE